MTTPEAFNNVLLACNEHFIGKIKQHQLLQDSLSHLREALFPVALKEAMTPEVVEDKKEE